MAYNTQQHMKTLIGRSVQRCDIELIFYNERIRKKEKIEKRKKDRKGRRERRREKRRDYFLSAPEEPLKKPVENRPEPEEEEGGGFWASRSA